VQKQHDQIATKLGNEGFVAKAPAAVVEGEKAKLAEFADQLVKIKANMEQIAAFKIIRGYFSPFYLGIFR
jgi:valyl-tRNA synthetase